MTYSITSNFTNLSMNQGKYVLYWEKKNFECTMNSMPFGLRKDPEQKYYPGRQYMK